MSHSRPDENEVYNYTDLNIRFALLFVKKEHLEVTHNT
jgi:hypothetical protein